MSKQRESRVAGRDTRTGYFVPVEETRRRPATTVREHVPLPGHGTEHRKPPKK